MQDCSYFWKNRKTYVLVPHKNYKQKDQENIKMVEDRKLWYNRKKEEFQRTFNTNATSKSFDASQTIAGLTNWRKFKSETYCSKCSLLIKNKLLPSYSKCKLKTSTTCICSKNVYKIPQISDVPKELLGMTYEQQNILRIFDIDIGKYERKQHRYRVKTDLTVEEKISSLQDEKEKKQLQEAFTFLMNNSDSYYRYYHDMILNGKKKPFWEVFSLRGIECALWPIMYYTKSLCESLIDGGSSHLSANKLFMIKCKCAILDFSINFELLQYQFDRYMYKTISGAIASGRKMGTTPKDSLSTKWFSPQYWQWQHAFLIDAVSQFGYPDMFITISPSEWYFPQNTTLRSAFEMAHEVPTKLPCQETFHFAHILEQIVRGYLCGSNTNRWKKHFCSHCRNGRNNVKTYFYRFEFQDRGTLHTHLLIWLQDLKGIDLKRITAEIPKDDLHTAFHIFLTQKSKTPQHDLLINEKDTSIDNEALHIKHPADAKAVNLRAYIDTLALSLRCSMDFQTCDVRAMILRYVAAYVSKMKDSIMCKGVLSADVTGHQAAFRYLIQYHPCEPENGLD